MQTHAHILTNNQHIVVLNYLQIKSKALCLAQQIRHTLELERSDLPISGLQSVLKSHTEEQQHINRVHHTISPK